jgi:hypothetical protein
MYRDWVCLVFALHSMNTFGHFSTHLTKKVHFQQHCHISRNLEMRTHLSREMRISKGDDTSPVANDRISWRRCRVSRGRCGFSCGRFARISTFRDMWHYSFSIIISAFKENLKNLAPSSSKICQITRSEKNRHVRKIGKAEIPRPRTRPKHRARRVDSDPDPIGSGSINFRYDEL